MSITLTNFNQNGCRVYRTLQNQISCLTYIIFLTNLFHNAFNNYSSEMFRPQFLPIFREHIFFTYAAYMSTYLAYILHILQKLYLKLK